MVKIPKTIANGAEVVWQEPAKFSRTAEGCSSRAVRFKTVQSAWPHLGVIARGSDIGPQMTFGSQLVPFGEGAGGLSWLFARCPRIAESGWLQWIPFE
jgi:hypothetical protein